MAILCLAQLNHPFQSYCFYSQESAVTAVSGVEEGPSYRHVHHSLRVPHNTLRLSAVSYQVRMLRGLACLIPSLRVEAEPLSLASHHQHPYHATSESDNPTAAPRIKSTANLLLLQLCSTWFAQRKADDLEPAHRGKFYSLSLMHTGVITPFVYPRGEALPRSPPSFSPPRH